MLLELREDRFEASAIWPVIANEFDAIDEQEEQARAEVRMTGQLFAFPTGEAFCDMTGYSPPTHPYRTPKGERVPAKRGDVSRGDGHFKHTVPVSPPEPGGRSKHARRQRAKHPAHFEWSDRETANRAEAIADAAAASRLRVKEANKQRWQREAEEKAAEEDRQRIATFLKGPTMLPVYCGNEPTDTPMHRTGDYEGVAPMEGEEFQVLWPGHPIHLRTLMCLSRKEITFASGEVKDAIVFDLDGLEMRIETSVCWPLWKFNILGEKRP